MASLAEKHTEGIREGILILSELLKLKSPQVKTSSAILIMASMVTQYQGTCTGQQWHITIIHSKYAIQTKYTLLNDPQQKRGFERFANEA